MARRQNDFYPSPSALIKPIVSLIPIDSLICEPCAGEGHLSKPLLELGYQVKTYDIDPRIKDCEYLDATVSVPKCDWVVTNPPFNQAEKIVRNSLESAKSVAMLLRLSFLEPCKNRRDLITGISKLILINPRPSFTGDGKTDSTSVAWFIWTGNPSPDIGLFVDWK